MTTRRTPRKLRDLLLTTLPAILILIAASSFAAEKIYFYHNDALGSPVAMTDSSGNVVWQEDYKPFGDVNNPSQQQQAANSHQFIGKELDEETGLHYFGARFYDAGTGRFLSVDPVRAVDAENGDISDDFLGEPQRLNYYVYSTNNPYRYIDPDGRVRINPNDPRYMGGPGGGVPLPLPRALERQLERLSKGRSAESNTQGVIPSSTGEKAAENGVGQAAGKAENNLGRAGKQERLREFANDDKLATNIRGQIKQDIKEIERGKRSRIRVPQGKDLAHRRGKEARKGYDYKHSDLQDRDIHKLQHKHEGYK